MPPLHTVELAKLQTMKDEERKQEVELVRWGAFLTADGEAALEAVAQKDPIMREAKEALEELSADPQVRCWAAASDPFAGCVVPSPGDRPIARARGT
jgi:hypothetical protein